LIRTKDTVQEKTFWETGTRAMRDLAQGDAPSGGTYSADSTEEVEIILQQRRPVRFGCSVRFEGRGMKQEFKTAIRSS